MCGLAGILELTRPTVDSAALSVMSSILRHRGPDDEGSYVSGPIGLGFRRLAILDLSAAGHQPMRSRDGRVVVVFNGEIYNYLELRRELQSLGHAFQSTGDTEVLLHAYLQWGPACLGRLNGMWAFLIWDARHQRLFGSRDRFGKKPIYMYRTPDRILFASEIKAILASGHYHGGVNWPVMSAFFLTDAFFQSLDTSQETFYTGIRQVPPGHAFEIDTRGAERQWRYWSIDGRESDDDIHDPAEAFYALFEDAVRLRLRSDVPVGVFLSGGLDSTSIACAVARLRGANSGAPLLAFSYQAEEYDESRYIEDTVRETGIELVSFRPEPRDLLKALERVLWYQDEPLHSIVAVITFELSRLAAERGVKVILNGGGPDEFLGYPAFFWYHWHTMIRRGRVSAAWREMRIHHEMHGGNPYRTLRSVLASQINAAVGHAPGRRRLASWKNGRRWRRNTWFTSDLTDRMAADALPSRGFGLDAALRYAVEVAPLPYYMRLEDRNSMAHSVEARMPFLDYRLVSLAFRLPAEWKIRSPWNKYVLRTAMRGRIPESVRSRPDKMGFPVPAARWFAGELYEPMQDLLSTQQVRERGIYRIAAIRQDLEQHRRGHIDVSGPLLKVLQFELWSRLQTRHREASVA